MLGFSLKEYLCGRSAVGTDFFGLANRIGFLFLAAEAVGTLDFPCKRTGGVWRAG